MKTSIEKIISDAFIGKTIIETNNYDGKVIINQKITGADVEYDPDGGYYIILL